MQEQLTSNVLMIRPINFTFNPETAGSNKFQIFDEEQIPDANLSAQRDFDEFVDQLRLRGINVVVFQDLVDPFTPDSIFPNNWLSTHHSGKVVLYPMEAPNRRLEKQRTDVIDYLKQYYDMNVVIDLSYLESQNLFLEGTGSLVLDRIHRTAFACLSSRTHVEALREWQQQISYDLFTFEALDKQGHPIYHTNVVMTMADNFCVVCLEAVPDPDQRYALKKKLEAIRKEIIEISVEQMMNYAGNMLLLKNKYGKRFMVMSKRAYRSLSPKQIRNIEDKAEIIAVNIDLIEKLGGGSARCMIAEIHLPEL